MPLAGEDGVGVGAPGCDNTPRNAPYYASYVSIIQYMCNTCVFSRGRASFGGGCPPRSSVVRAAHVKGLKGAARCSTASTSTRAAPGRDVSALLAFEWAHIHTQQSAQVQRQAARPSKAPPPACRAAQRAPRTRKTQACACACSAAVPNNTKSYASEGLRIAYYIGRIKVIRINTYHVLSHPEGRTAARLGDSELPWCLVVWE
jgi:hypothetical protein